MLAGLTFRQDVVIMTNTLHHKALLITSAYCFEARCIKMSLPWSSIVISRPRVELIHSYIDIRTWTFVMVLSVYERICTSGIGTGTGHQPITDGDFINFHSTMWINL